MPSSHFIGRTEYRVAMLIIPPFGKVTETGQKPMTQPPVFSPTVLYVGHLPNWKIAPSLEL